MSNTSATGGYLTPGPTTPPLEDDALADFLQEVFVGVSGLPGSNVRPRWQPEPPNLPDRDVTWLALGVISQRRDLNATVRHNPTGDGSDELIRNEELDVMLSAYGPAAGQVAAYVSDGLEIPQNREALRAAGFALVEATTPQRVPTLIKEKWLARVDLLVTLRREIRRVYPVLNLLRVGGVIETPVFSIEFNT